MESLHEIIGKCVERDNKRYFEELKRQIGYAEAVLSDPAWLPRLRGLYCELAGFAEARLTGRRRDRAAAEHRRVLIAVLHRLYYPNTLNPHLSSPASRPFHSALARLLNIHLKHICDFSRKSCFFYVNYEDFTRRVDDLYAKIVSDIQTWESTDPK